MQELFLEFRYKLITPGLNRVNSEFNIKKTNEKIQKKKIQKEGNQSKERKNEREKEMKMLLKEKKSKDKEKREKFYL